jgi:hypothetical protein
MAARHLNLLLDKVEVVEQPLCGMGNPSILTHGLRGVVVGPQNLLVLIQSRQQPTRPPMGDDLMIVCQSFGVVDQLFKSVKLGTQGSIISKRTPSR